MSYVLEGDASLGRHDEEKKRGVSLYGDDDRLRRRPALGVGRQEAEQNRRNLDAVIES